MLKDKKIRVVLTLILFVISLGLGIYGFIISGLNPLDDSNGSSLNESSGTEKSSLINDIILPTVSLYNLDKIIGENDNEYCFYYNEDDVCSTISINNDGKMVLYDSELDKTYVDTSIDSEVKSFAIDETCSGDEIVALTTGGDLYISIANMSEEPDGDLELSQYIFPFTKIETNYKFTNVWRPSFGIEDYEIGTSCGVYTIYGLTTTNELRVISFSENDEIYIGNKRSNLVNYIAEYEYEPFTFYLSKYGYIQLGTWGEEKFYNNYILDENNELVISKMSFSDEDNNLYIITTDNYLLKLDYNENSKTNSYFIAKKLNVSKIKNIINNKDKNTYLGNVIISFENNEQNTYEYSYEFNLDKKY